MNIVTRNISFVAPEWYQIFIKLFNCSHLLRGTTDDGRMKCDIGTNDTYSFISLLCLLSIVNVKYIPIMDHVRVVQYHFRALSHIH